MIADNRIWFGKDGTSRPAYKRFLSEVSDTIPATTMWLYDEVGHNDLVNKEIRALFETTVPFDTPKPTTLIKRILQIASDPDSIILDFFSGSATTAHAVMQLNAEGGNRRFIMVQLPEVCGEKTEAYKAGYVYVDGISYFRTERSEVIFAMFCGCRCLQRRAKRLKSNGLFPSFKEALIKCVCGALRIFCHSFVAIS